MRTTVRKYSISEKINLTEHDTTALIKWIIHHKHRLHTLLNGGRYLEICDLQSNQYRTVKKEVEASKMTYNHIHDKTKNVIPICWKQNYDQSFEKGE